MKVVIRIFFTAFFSIFVFQLSIMAEVILDGTCGQQLEISGPDYLIKDEYGKLVGNNLFHSFQFFNVDTNEKAIFTASPDFIIQNIISRVTGGSLSLIDGTIQSNIEGANLYLLNPSGIMFGPNASINIDGSFHVSTADYLKMGENYFSASQPKISKFSSVQPDAFGFLENNINGSININGSTLQVMEDKTLSIVGGDVSIDNGVLFAPKGRINIASIASGSKLFFKENTLNINDFDKAGDIYILNKSRITTLGSSGGNIYITGDNLEINDSLIQAEIYGDLDGGVIDIRLKGDLTLNNKASICGGTGFDNSGRGASIHIDVSNLNLLNLSLIDASSYGNGQGGYIDINANDTIYLSGGTNPTELNDIPLIFTGIFSIVNGTGAGGSISIKTKNLILNDYQQITTKSLMGSGKPGDIFLNAKEHIHISQESGIASNTYSHNDAGDILIETPTLIMDNGWIHAFSAGSGNAGDINIYAGTVKMNHSSNLNSSGSITIFNMNSDSIGGNIFVNANKNIIIKGGSFISSKTLGEGDAGSIEIESPLLTIDKGTISVNSEDGEGKSGDININVEKLEMIGDEGYSMISTSSKGGTYGKKTSGDITITAEDSVILDGKRWITARTDGDGTGGSINITTPYFKMINGYIDSSSSKNGKAGNINLWVENADLIYDMTNDDLGMISTSSKGGQIGDDTGGTINIFATDRLNINEFFVIKSTSEGNGNAGKINLDASSLILDNNVYLKANTTGSGNAGSIIINAKEQVVLNNSKITTGTESTGNGGSIDINANNITLNHSNIVATTFSDGQGGIINISSKNSIHLTDGSEISVATYFENKEAGRAGYISIQSNSLHLLEDSCISSTSYYYGDGGDININSDFIKIYDGSSIDASTLGNSNAGNMNINSDQILITGENDEGFLSQITTSTFENGNAGSIEINSNIIELIHGQIHTTSGFGIGHSGSIKITAKDYITIISEDKSNPFSGTISVSSYGYGNSGYVDISTLQLNIIGGEISAFTSDGDGQFNKISANNISITQEGIIDTSTDGVGRGGDLTIKSDNLFISNGSTINSSTYGSGDGGEINIESKGSIFIDSKSSDYFGTISSDTIGTGNGGNIILSTANLKLHEGYISSESDFTGLAGNININVGKAFISFDSYISTATEMADGGDIQISANDLLFLKNNEISTSVNDDIGDGGNISIDPTFVIIDNSTIIANANEGDGGNISIKSDYFFKWPNSIIKASSKKGVSGEVKIQSSVKDISSGLTLLPESFFDAVQLIKQACLTKDNENQFSFLTGSRESFPPLPYDFYNKESKKDDSDLMKQLAEVLKYIDKKIMYDALIKRLDEIKNTAERNQEKNVLSFAYGYTGYIFKELGRVDDAVVETRRAIFWAQQNYSPETEFLWHAQLGRILKETDTENAIKSYKYSIHLLGDTFKEITNTTFNNKIIKSFNTRQEIINKLINSTNNTKQKINKILSLNKNNDFFNEYVKPVYFELAGILFDKSRIEEATEVLELLKDFEIQQFFKDECAARLKTEPLKYLPPKTALIQFVPLSQKLLILLTLPALDKKKPDIITAYISQKKLNRFIGQLMNEIKTMNPEVSNIKKLSKKLYDQLINPIKTTLENQKIETLVLLPEGIVRKIPFSVLYDGHKYLIERYALAVIPSKTQVNMSSDFSYDNILIGALSGEMYQLSSVSYEIEQIKTKFPECKTLLNENFIYNNLSKALDENDYSIVHIASHAHFGSTSDDIFITLWNDKKLIVNDFIKLLEHSKKNNKRIELLTLSACETAKENDRFLLGLTGVAMKAGVKSVIGSLWNVYDKETSEIMEKFYYRLKNQSITKAKALQMSITAMIDQNTNPAYWAPFILVGNWL